MTKAKFPLMDREWIENHGKNKFDEMEQKLKRIQSCDCLCCVLLDCRNIDSPVKHSISYEKIPNINTLEDLVLHAALLIESADENTDDIEDYGHEHWSDMVEEYKPDLCIGVETSDEGDGFHFYYGEQFAVFMLISDCVPERVI